MTTSSDQPPLTKQAPPGRPPDFHGPAGEVWQITLPTPPSDPAKAATLQAWLVHTPESHPFWPWYLLAVIHLRDIPGVPPAHRDAPEMTHELMVLALNPERPLPDPDAFDADAFQSLRPIDQVVQFTVNSDAEARKVGDLAALGCCSGTLVPDQDYRPVWNEAIPAVAGYVREQG